MKKALRNEKGGFVRHRVIGQEHGNDVILHVVEDGDGYKCIARYQHCYHAVDNGAVPWFTPHHFASEEGACDWMENYSITMEGL